MDEEIQRREDFLSNYELEKELSALVDKTVIPSFVADKIKEKISTKGVKLTLVQLYELVDIIKNNIEIRKHSKYNAHLKEKREPDSPNNSAAIEDEDVKELLNTIDGLSGRVNKIEEARIKDYGDTKSKIVTTEDIVTPEKIGVPQRGGGVYPLQRLPGNSEGVVVLMKWLQYLVDKVGKTNLSDVLEYYADIGWLSDNIITNLLEYSEGITQDKKELEGTKKKLSDLQAKDHIQSLLFIQRLRGEQQDNHFLDRIERELSKMTKKLDSI
ncbi:MAG: hypothetical protein JSW62_01405 [Thermoplasmatales archaeon]|nr:MAG: hypothetical protein JSW62_01405 [Thermoplasmatales archaeon]